MGGCRFALRGGRCERRKSTAPSEVLVETSVAGDRRLAARGRGAAPSRAFRFQGLRQCTGAAGLAPGGCVLRGRAVRILAGWPRPRAAFGDGLDFVRSVQPVPFCGRNLVVHQDNYRCRRARRLRRSFSFSLDKAAFKLLPEPIRTSPNRADFQHTLTFSYWNDELCSERAGVLLHKNPFTPILSSAVRSVRARLVAKRQS